jgi:hypothetical protein
VANGFVIKFASGKYLQDIDSDLEGGYPVVLTHEFENAVVIPREKLAKTIAGLISDMSPVLVVVPFEEEHRVAGIEHLRILIRHGDMTQRDVVAARREPISEAEAWGTINAWIASGEISVDSRNRLHF